MNITKNISWNFPILTKIKNYYLTNGLIKTLGWIVCIVIGTKIIIINGAIGLINYLFSTDIPYGPILYYLGGIEIETIMANVGSRD
mgnify:FL=1